jgi:hypothetical protein
MRALVRPLNAFEKLETEGGRPTPSPTTARRLDAHRSIVNFLTSRSKDSFSNCPIARSSNNYPELCSTSSGQDSAHGGNSESHSPAFHPWPKLSQERGQGVPLARRQTTSTPLLSLNLAPRYPTAVLWNRSTTSDDFFLGIVDDRPSFATGVPVTCDRVPFMPRYREPSVTTCRPLSSF